jgi:hypothetical protein
MRVAFLTEPGGLVIGKAFDVVDAVAVDHQAEVFAAFIVLGIEIGAVADA